MGTVLVPRTYKINFRSKEIPMFDLLFYDLVRTINTFCNKLDNFVGLKNPIIFTTVGLLGEIYIYML